MLKKKVNEKHVKNAKTEPAAKRQEKKGLNLGLLLVVFLFLATTGVFMLVQHQYSVRNDLKSRSVQARISSEKSKQEQLRLTLARLKSPGRVASIAADELGLSDPSGVIYLKYTRDAAGNMVCQSTLEELTAPRPETQAEPDSSPSKAEANVVEKTGGGR